MPWSATEVWRRESAHKDVILKGYFAPDDSKIAACTATQHKVIQLSMTTLCTCSNFTGIKSLLQELLILQL